MQAMTPKPLANQAPNAAGGLGAAPPGAPAGAGAGFSTQDALNTVESDPDMAELERLTRLYNANSSSPTMQMEIWRRMQEVHARMRNRNESRQRAAEHERFVESQQRQQGAADARAKDLDHYRFVNWMRRMHPEMNSRQIEEAWNAMVAGGANDPTFDAFERYKRASAIQAASAPQPADGAAEANWSHQVRSDNPTQVEGASRGDIDRGDIEAARREAETRQAQNADPAFRRNREQLQQIERMMTDMKLSQDTMNMIRQRLRSGATPVDVMNFLNQVARRGGNADWLTSEVLNRAGQANTPLDVASDPNRAQRLAAALANGKITADEYNRYMYNEEPLPPNLM